MKKEKSLETLERIKGNYIQAVNQTSYLYTAKEEKKI